MPTRHGDYGRVRRLSVVTLASLLICVYAFQLTYNTTDSLPVGIYRVRELRGEPKRGDVVGICLEGAVARLALERGYVHRQVLKPYIFGARCASGAALIGKPVLGLPGDTVEIRSDGISINGTLVENSRSLARDRTARKMPHPRWGTRVLGSGEYWVRSPFSARSFDSRYFGTVRPRTRRIEADTGRLGVL